ncbi:MAG: hypothetical protein MHM6MM_004515 [Cercozoa sp. M6MM]
MQNAEIVSDWHDRDFLTSASHSIFRLATFLDDFDAQVRRKLSKLSMKLEKLERQADYLEASMDSANPLNVRERHREPRANLILYAASTAAIPID